MRLAFVVVAAAVALGGATRAPRWIVTDAAAEPCAAPRFDAATAVARTAASLDAALDARDLADRGRVWLGRLRSVGFGRRDTMVWTPDAIDPARPLEVVVYLEGFDSFAPAAMDHRHAAAIERVAAVPNAVYVAPDAPSSAHGNRRAATPYWRAGCAARACAGGHAAPGDFVQFVADVRARLGAMTCTAPDRLALRVHLVGFSNGGKGVRDAIAQLAAAGFQAGGHRVEVGEVVFADGNYGAAWLADAWRPLAARPGATLTILVGAGAAGAGNRRRALDFLRVHLPKPRLSPDGRVEPARIRLHHLPLSHRGIGDAAVEHLRMVAER